MAFLNENEIVVISDVEIETLTHDSSLQRPIATVRPLPVPEEEVDVRVRRNPTPFPVFQINPDGNAQEILTNQ
ncbi:Retina-specific copper amine oxidase, partial [Clarias magur]